MNPFRFVCVWLVMLCLSVASAGVSAQETAGTDYQPVVGQAGKDVGWIPTEQAVVDLMLDMAKVTPEDYVIDLGSGDGRTVITAAKRGARALGIEYNPDMVALSKRRAADESVADKAQFLQADLFQIDFSQATVITLFLRGDLNLKLRPRILDMKPGTRVVSNSFPMEEWKPDQTASVEEERCANLCCTAYFWVVPAKVAGTWKLAQGEVAFRQSFQVISGTITSGATSLPVTGRLVGDGINFTVGDATYTGRVSGSTMQGTFTSRGNTAPWSATRTP
jgi:precorrin-6B methylase 2